MANSTIAALASSTTVTKIARSKLRLNVLANIAVAIWHNAARVRDLLVSLCILKNW